MPLVCTSMIDEIAHLGLLDDDAMLLDVSALEVASLDHPGAAMEPYLSCLAEMHDRIAERGGDAVAASQRAALLAEVIAGEFGFAGDRDTYDDPGNADLMHVVDTRRGLPVSLAILYVAAARRLNWSADALNTPGHVLVRIGSPTEPILIDPFDRGAVVGPQALASLLAAMLGPSTSPSVDHLTPMTNRAVLVRLLMNQASRAEAAGQGERALVLYRRMTTIAPFNAPIWWERGRLELRRGNVAAARASLSAMLEVTREPGLRAHVFAALDAMPRAEP